MKNFSLRNWGSNSSARKKLSLDQATVFGGLTILIVAYIVLKFIYPLIEKGILW